MSGRGYYDKKIKLLEKEIAALQSQRDNISVETLREFKVSCSENNSGGSFWLRAKHYDALEQRGFKTVRSARGFSKVVFARTESEAEAQVKSDFWDATTINPDTEGCNCCEQPFYFSVDDASYLSYWEEPNYNPNKYGFNLRDSDWE